MKNIFMKIKTIKINIIKTHNLISLKIYHADFYNYLKKDSNKKHIHKMNHLHKT